MHLLHLWGLLINNHWSIIPWWLPWWLSVRKQLTGGFLCTVLDLLFWILCSLLIREYSGISIRAWVPMSFFLSFSLSLYFWLIPWSMKASCVTQGILASFLLSLAHRRLQTTRFQSNRGPTSGAQTGTLVYMADLDRVTLEGLLRPVGTKTWVNQLESPLTFLLYLSLI